MNHKYNLEIVANNMYHDTRFGCDAMIHMITFRDKREDVGDPDAYNDYFASQPPDPFCDDYFAEENRRYGLRQQWKRDVLDALGLRFGQVGHTGSEFFTAIEITEP